MIIPKHQQCTCAKCGGVASLSMGQNFWSGLAWFKSFRCTGCGDAWELDEVGIPPPEIRQRMLAEGGHWQARIAEPRSAVAIAKALRVLLELDMAASARLMKSLPGIVYEGTNVECRWVAAHLGKIGETVLVEQVVAGSVPDPRG